MPPVPAAEALNHPAQALIMQGYAEMVVLSTGGRLVLEGGGHLLSSGTQPRVPSLRGFVVLSRSVVFSN